MRKIYMLFVLLMVAITSGAQSSKTVNVTTPGTLGTLLGEDLSEITDLTVTGKMNNTDFMVFSNITNLTNLDLAGVTIVDADGNETGTIPDYSMSLNRTLKKIVMPSSLLKVGERAFFKCKLLEKVIFSEGLQSIGKSAFMSCAVLESVNFPASLEKIDDRAFYKTVIKEFVAPESLKSLGVSSFYGTALTKVSINEKTEKIGESAFGGCVDLASFEVDEKSTNFKVIDGVLLTYDATTLVAFPQADPRVKYIMPQTVTTVYMSAFDCAEKLEVLRINNGVATLPVSMCYGAKNLQKIYIPASATLLKAGCMDNCKSLTEVHVRATTPPEAETGAFGVMFPNYKMNLYVPTGHLDKYKEAAEWKDAFLSYNEEDIPQVTMTTSREIGEYISLSIKTEEPLEIIGAEYDSPGAFKITDKNIVIKGAISKLECSSDSLTSLDVSKSPLLEELFCDDNALTELVLGNNSALKTIYCGGNKINNLNLENLPALIDFSCWGNQLEAIDLSHNSELASLVCRDNMIAGTLDLSANAKVREVNCYNNALTAIKLAANSELRHIELQRNNINGENMTAFMEALPTYVAYSADEWDDWFGMNLQGLYLIEKDPTLEQNAATAVDIKIAKDKGWPIFVMNIEDYGLVKPTPYDEFVSSVQTINESNAGVSFTVSSSAIEVKGLAGGENVVLYDANGRVVGKKQASASAVSFDTTGLAKGVYVVSTSAERHKIVVK